MRSDSITCPALRTVCLSRDLPQHRRISKIPENKLKNKHGVISAPCLYTYKRKIERKEKKIVFSVIPGIALVSMVTGIIAVCIDCISMFADNPVISKVSKSDNYVYILAIFLPARLFWEMRLRLYF